MTTLPIHLTNPHQLTVLETCLQSVFRAGFTGLRTVDDTLAAELTRLLPAHVTIRYDAPRFVLIIQNRREKFTIMGRILTGEHPPFTLTLDGHPVNDGLTLLTTIYHQL